MPEKEIVDSLCRCGHKQSEHRNTAYDSAGKAFKIQVFSVHFDYLRRASGLKRKYLPYIMLLIAGTLDIASTLYGLSLNGVLVWQEGSPIVVNGMSTGHYKAVMLETRPFGLYPLAATAIFCSAVYVINHEKLNQHKAAKIVSKVLTAGIVLFSFHPFLNNMLVITDVLGRLVI
jgi:hypothetical protein